MLWKLFSLICRIRWNYMKNQRHCFACVTVPHVDVYRFLLNILNILIEFLSTSLSKIQTVVKTWQIKKDTEVYIDLSS